MKQLLVISGKGGTGKTTIVRSFIELGNFKAFADCDVDAPNLGLVTNLNIRKDEYYYGMNKAYIDMDKCNLCNTCIKHCNFSAIRKLNKTIEINPYSCEGCGVCEKICSLNAISMKENIAGELSLYKEDSIVFSTAKLKIGEGNSGLLVSKVKKNLIENTKEDIAIIDGSPGIGCPVIASINDVHMALIVTEPSKSGLSDLKRIVKVARKFNTKLGICINKFDINERLTCEIEKFARDNNIKVLGKIHYDNEIIKALNRGISPINTQSKVSSDIEALYKNTLYEFKKI